VCVCVIERRSSGNNEGLFACRSRRNGAARSEEQDTCWNSGCWMCFASQRKAVWLNRSPFLLRLQCFSSPSKGLFTTRARPMCLYYPANSHHFNRSSLCRSQPWFFKHGSRALYFFFSISLQCFIKVNFGVDFKACENHLQQQSTKRMLSKRMFSVPPCVWQPRLSAPVTMRWRKSSDIIAVQSSHRRLFHYTGNEEWDRSELANEQF